MSLSKLVKMKNTTRKSQKLEPEQASLLFIGSISLRNSFEGSLTKKFDSIKFGVGVPGHRHVELQKECCFKRMPRASLFTSPSIKFKAEGN